MVEVDEEKWTITLGRYLVDQLPLYLTYVEERTTLYKCLAIIVSHSSDKNFVNQEMDVMLASMRQHSAQDSKVRYLSYIFFR